MERGLFWCIQRGMTTQSSLLPPYRMAPVVGSGGWDHRFLQLALHFGTWSKDPSTKLGCVIVGPDREIRSTGFNGFPRGVQDRQERLQNRELKYLLICHAEENAILHAARIGVSLKGCTSYCLWSPCSRCARSLINAGVSEVVYSDKEVPERWQEDFNLGLEILHESGVVTRSVPLRAKTPTIEVADCTHCGGLTLAPEHETCGCGSPLHPVSREIPLGTTIRRDLLG